MRKVSKQSLWGWSGASVALMLVTVAAQLPGPVRAVAALVGAGIWVAARAGRIEVLRMPVTGELGRISTGTLLYGWGVASVAAAVAAAVGNSGLVHGALGAAVAFLAIFAMATSRLLMIAAVGTALAAGLVRARYGRVEVSQ